MQLPACDAFAGTVLEDEFLMSEPVQAAGGDHTIKITVAFLTERIAGCGLAQGANSMARSPRTTGSTPELAGGSQTPGGAARSG